MAGWGHRLLLTDRAGRGVQLLLSCPQEGAAGLWRSAESWGMGCWGCLAAAGEAPGCGAGCLRNCA